MTSRITRRCDADARVTGTIGPAGVCPEIRVSTLSPFELDLLGFVGFKYLGSWLEFQPKFLNFSVQFQLSAFWSSLSEKLSDTTDTPSAELCAEIWKVL